MEIMANLVNECSNVIVEPSNISIDQIYVCYFFFTMLIMQSLSLSLSLFLLLLFLNFLYQLLQNKYYLYILYWKNNNNKLCMYYKEILELLCVFWMIGSKYLNWLHFSISIPSNPTSPPSFCGSWTCNAYVPFYFYLA